jgi:hypothetical protein
VFCTSPRYENITCDGLVYLSAVNIETIRIQINIHLSLGFPKLQSSISNSFSITQLVNWFLRFIGSAEIVPLLLISYIVIVIAFYLSAVLFSKVLISICA